MNSPVSPPSPVLRCATTDDFLAALPWLTGLTLEPGIFVVLFRGTRAERALRFELPAPGDDRATFTLLDSLCALLQHSGAAMSRPAIVLVTDEMFGARDIGARAAEAYEAEAQHVDADSSEWRLLAEALTSRFHREGWQLREFAVVAADSWATLIGAAAYRRQSLSTIAARSHELTLSLDAPAPRSLHRLATLPEVDRAFADAISVHLQQLDAGGAQPAGARSVNAAHEVEVEVEAKVESEIEGVTESSENVAWAHGIAHVAAACFDPATEDDAAQELWHPRLAARFIRACQSPRGWLVSALTALCRPEFVAALCEQHDSQAIFDTPEAGLLQFLRSAAEERPDPARLTRAATALRRITPHAPRNMQGNLLALLAWVWWHTGMQSLAHHYAGEALAIDPENQFGAVVAALNEAPPHWQLERLQLRD